jgi:hypothetical protein
VRETRGLGWIGDRKGNITQYRNTLVVRFLLGCLNSSERSHFRARVRPVEGSRKAPVCSRPLSLPPPFPAMTPSFSCAFCPPQPESPTHVNPKGTLSITYRVLRFHVHSRASSIARRRDSRTLPLLTNSFAFLPSTAGQPEPPYADDGDAAGPSVVRGRGLRCRRHHKHRATRHAPQPRIVAHGTRATQI